MSSALWDSGYLNSNTGYGGLPLWVRTPRVNPMRTPDVNPMRTPHVNPMRTPRVNPSSKRRYASLLVGALMLTAHGAPRYAMHREKTRI